MEQKPPRVLYHYCSLSTFKSIFDNKSIWLSDIRRSNDSMELQWIMNQCWRYIGKVWINYYESVEKERGTGIVTAAHFDLFETYFNLAKDYNAEEDTKNWVFCLSQKSDDLGQWRGYADDGRGVAIGFNSATLKKINYIGNNIQTTGANLQFNQVHYSKRDLENLFYSDAGLSKITVDMDPEQVLKHIKYALGAAYLYAPLYKNDKFKEEKEWRIFYSMYLSSLKEGQTPGVPRALNMFSDEIVLEKYAFSQKGNTLVSHLELEFPKFSHAIHSITIGPKAKITPLDLQLYLISLGMLKSVHDKTIKITKSNISYR